MGVAKVDVLYLHQPDTSSPLTDTLECTHALMKEGLVAAFGLSNYSAVEVERCVAICKEKGYALPVVYQGLYNAINRRVEDDPAVGHLCILRIYLRPTTRCVTSMDSIHPRPI